MTPKKRIIEGKDRIKGGKGVKNDSKKSFTYDPLGGVGASDMIDIGSKHFLKSISSHCGPPRFRRLPLDEHCTTY